MKYLGREEHHYYQRKICKKKGNIDVKSTGDYVDGVDTEIKNTGGFLLWHIFDPGQKS